MPRCACCGVPCRSTRWPSSAFDPATACLSTSGATTPTGSAGSPGGDRAPRDRRQEVQATCRLGPAGGPHERSDRREPRRSRRHRELCAPWFGDELRAVCVGDTGMWGAILMRRERGAPELHGARRGPARIALRRVCGGAAREARARPLRGRGRPRSRPAAARRRRWHRDGQRCRGRLARRAARAHGDGFPLS